MSYEERIYRSILNKERYNYFNVIHLETDLWIGLSKIVDPAELQTMILEEIKMLRQLIETFIADHPEFSGSFTPLHYSEQLAPPIRGLVEASAIAGTGPMAGIAGLFSEYIGKKILDAIPGKEVLVENGGDIFAASNAPLIISIYAGSSSLSNKIAINLPAGMWGICTSSGTVGHSKSFGRADAVTVVSSSTILADTLATQIANAVNSPEDIQAVIEDSAKYQGIEGLVIICEDKVGISGKLEILPV